jgi:hypothetical protein
MLFNYPIRAEIPADFYGLEGPLSLGQPLAEADTSCAAFKAIRELAMSIINARPRPESADRALANSLRPLASR